MNTINTILSEWVSLSIPVRVAISVVAATVLIFIVHVAVVLFRGRDQRFIRPEHWEISDSRRAELEELAAEQELQMLKYRQEKSDRERKSREDSRCAASHASQMAFGSFGEPCTPERIVTIPNLGTFKIPEGMFRPDWLSDLEKSLPNNDHERIERERKRRETLDSGEVWIEFPEGDRHYIDMFEPGDRIGKCVVADMTVENLEQQRLFSNYGSTEPFFVGPKRQYITIKMERCEE